MNYSQSTVRNSKGDMKIKNLVGGVGVWGGWEERSRVSAGARGGERAHATGGVRARVCRCGSEKTKQGVSRGARARTAKYI